MIVIILALGAIIATLQNLGKIMQNRHHMTNGTLFLQLAINAVLLTASLYLLAFWWLPLYLQQRS